MHHDRMDEDDTALVLTALFDIRSNVQLLVDELIGEDDGPGETEED